MRCLVIISERNREEKQLTMLESAGKRTSYLPVFNDKANYGRLGGTYVLKVAVEILITCKGSAVQLLVLELSSVYYLWTDNRNPQASQQYVIMIIRFKTRSTKELK